jgi:hypothetical protein
MNKYDGRGPKGEIGFCLCSRGGRLVRIVGRLPQYKFVLSIVVTVDKVQTIGM